MYIYLGGKPGQVVNCAQELGDGIVVDYTSGGGIYGIEILDASDRLGLRSDRIWCARSGISCSIQKRV
jgi:uncharacterized protein YuzE